MKLSLDVLGGKELAAQLRAAGGRLDNAAKVGAYNVNLAILAPAVRNAPKRWGVLRGSGHVTLPTIDASGNVLSTVGFGGPAQAYAMVQHENLTFKHTEGGPKYLENAVKAVQPRVAAIFLDAARRAFEGKVQSVTPMAPTTPNEGPRPPSRSRRRRRRKRAKK